MKTSSETLDLLTVTHQNGFAAQCNRRANLNLTCDKYREPISLSMSHVYLSQDEITDEKTTYFGDF